jgi:hypothetical protein
MTTFTQRMIIKNKEDEEKVALFQRYGLGTLIDNKNMKCKHCPIQVPLESLERKNNFWTCPKGHDNKYNEKYVLTSKEFKFDFSNLINIINTKINSSLILNKNTYLLYLGNQTQVPIFLIDVPLNSSIAMEGIGKSSLLIYQNEELKKRSITAYNKNNFIDLYSFFNESNDNLLRKLESISQSSYPLKVLTIFDRINRFVQKNKTNYEAFEIEATRLFNELKTKEKEIENLLSFLSYNRNNPTGNKFVHIGSNYPVDFCSIELFSYFNEVFEVSSKKGYDAKMFTSELTYSTYQKKKESNPGKSLVFITSTEKIDNKIWRDILEAKKNNGNWIYLLIDLDLLSLLLFYIGYENYFS